MYLLLIVLLSTFGSLNKDHTNTETDDFNLIIKAPITEQGSTNRIPTIYKESTTRGCLDMWTVTIERDTVSEGWILTLTGIPVRITKFSCATGGGFQCPLCVNDEVEIG